MAINQDQSQYKPGFENLAITDRRANEAQNFTYGAGSGTSAAQEAANARNAASTAGGLAANAGANSAHAQQANAQQITDASSVAANNIASNGQHAGAVVQQYGQGQANDLRTSSLQQGQQLTQANQAFGQQGQQLFQSGAGAQGRLGAQATYGAATGQQATATGYGSQLAGLEAQQGPSGAQAQLASATSQNNAQALALARSGRGFGGSASALTAAAGQQAATNQQAASASAQLAAQENAAWRTRQAGNLTGAAGIASNVAGQNIQQQQFNAGLAQQQLAQNDAQQIALQGQGLQAQQAALQGQQGAANLQLQGQTNAANMGLAATQAGQELGQQGLVQGAQTRLQGGQIATQGLANAGNVAQQGYGTNAQTTMQGEGLAQQVYGQDLNASQNYAQLQFNREEADRQETLARDQLFKDWVGVGAQGIGGMMSAMSDMTAKTDIEDASGYYGLSGSTQGDPYGLSYSTQAGDPYGLSYSTQAGDPYDLNASNTSGKDAKKKDEGQNKTAKAMGAAFSQAGASANSRAPLTSYAPTAVQTPYGPRYMLSDERTKEGKGKPGSERLRGALDDIEGMIASLGNRQEQLKAGLEVAEGTHPYTYRYKDPDAHGHGTRLGIMAQDLERTLPGQTMVQAGPDGKKRVDVGQLAMANAAGVAGLADKFKELEAKISKLGGKKAA